MRIVLLESATPLLILGPQFTSSYNALALLPAFSCFTKASPHKQNSPVLDFACLLIDKMLLPVRQAAVPPKTPSPPGIPYDLFIVRPHDFPFSI
jgi:hypothetical protein